MTSADDDAPLVGAVADYEAALAIDPLNKNLAKDLQRIRRTLAARGGESREDDAAKAADHTRADEQTD